MQREQLNLSISSDDEGCWGHHHDFVKHNTQGEKRTLYILILTFVTMAVEIVAGTIYGSMALLADGWHMGTHAAAFCITLYTYHYAKKHQQDAAFSFGVGKVGVLGGFTSAVALVIVAIIMFLESMHRIINPQVIHFNEAILVAIIGLIVNVVSMMLLHGHTHGHSHNHSHHAHGSDNHSSQDAKSSHEHHDHNLKAAYLHVLADALTSLLAIAALIVGKYLGWSWLDPIMGIIGSLLIVKWAIGLINQTAPVLLDKHDDIEYQTQIIERLEAENCKVVDFHLWPLSSDHLSLAVVIVARSSNTLAHYQQIIDKFDKINHSTIEVHYVIDNIQEKSSVSA